MTPPELRAPANWPRANMGMGRLAHRMHAMRPDSSKISLRALYLIALSLTGYLVLNAAINGSENSTRSFLLAVGAGALALVPLMYCEAARQYGATQFGINLIIVYLLKVAIGTLHFIIYIQPDYFSGNTEFAYHWDFMWLDQSMQVVAETWQANGLFSPLSEEYWQFTKNGGLLAFMGLNYYVAGSFPLNVSPWNALFGIYSAVLIMEIALSFGLPRAHLRLVAWVMFLLPFNLITSIHWRDTTGQTLIFLGVYVLAQTRVKLQWWFLVLPLAGFLAYQQREPYLFVIFLGATVWLLNEFRRSRYMPILVGFALLLALIWVPLAQRISTFAFVRYTNPEDGISLASFLARGTGLPVRILRGIVGPFPWNQYIQQVTGYEYQPADYLQHVLNLTIFCCALPLAWKLFRAERKLDLCMILGLGFFLMGVVATGVHSAYVSLGMPLLLPLAVRVGRHEFFKVLMISIMIFLSANLIYVGLGLQGSNFFQVISGGY